MGVVVGPSTLVRRSYALRMMGSPLVGGRWGTPPCNTQAQPLNAFGFRSDSRSGEKHG